MSNVKINSSRKHTISATNTYELGDASGGVVGTFAVHIVANGFTGSITVKARSRVAEAQSDGITFQPIPYEKLYLNGAVGDGSLVSTAITGNSIILIPASGLEVALDATVTAGSVDVYVMPLEGAAA